MVYSAQSAIALFRDLIFTPFCISCEQMGVHLCEPCADLIEPYQSPNGSLPIWSAMPYGGWLRDHIIAFKNGARFESVGLALILDTVLEHAHLTEPFYLVPVPSTKAKVAQRGYDTIRLLTRSMEPHQLCLGVARNFILPNRVVEDQVGLNPTQRRDNLRYAFSPTKAHAPGNYVIVDDVTTTGATIQAMADAIKTAGGTTICAITLCGSAKGV